ncbi:hypothetical protein LCGC14_2587530, partial [marine sediment metagenome]
MPDKPLTAKRQAFCQAYCDNGHNASKAYKVAYPGCKSGHRQNGNRLITKDDIVQEISRIKGAITARSEYDVDQCDKQYSDIIALAIELKQPSAAVSAITGRARLRGW